MSLNNVQLLLASDETAGDSYKITNSLRLRKSATGYLNRTFGTPTSSTTWTVSLWFKRGEISAAHSHLFTTTLTDNFIRFQTGTDILQYSWANGSTVQSTAVFRDTSAWYHLVVAVDTTQATSSDRIRMYINGSEIAYGTSTYPTQNATTLFNTARAHYLSFTSNQFDGYVAEVNWIDGQALTPSSFGAAHPVTGVWRPKAYTGTYGTNGFYLPFSDNSALTTSSNAGLGKDFSGNGNYFATNNISITSGTTYDSMTDVPTLTSATAGNYCVLNPLNKNSSLGSPTNGNLTQVMNVNNSTIFCSMGVSSGKWYWETTCTSITSLAFGLGIASDAQTLTTAIANDAGSYGYYTNGQKINNNTFTTYGASYATGDIIGIALDMDGGTITFYKNNTSQGTAFTGLSGTKYPALGGFSASSSTVSMNFGQQPFTYTPPTGYVALNTYNLPDPAVGATLATKPNRFMDATLYTGTGATQSITNAGGFKPDLVWTKARNQAYGHALFDSVRGAGNALQSNNTNAEDAWGSSTLASFDSNGFTAGADTSYLVVNSSGNTFVAWQWQAGQGTTSSNTQGSITSTVSVNASAGFSVVTYTGTGANATVGHGLGVAPSMIIVKNRTTAGSSWNIYHKSVGATGYLQFTTAATTTSALSWNNTSPTSSVFSIGTGADVNTNTANIVAYCWAEIAGFSKFGSYTGNGSTSGPFVYLGFRPKFIMVKCSSAATYNWNTYDSARDLYNTTDDILQANTSSAEFTNDTANPLDFLSNGFKIRGSNAANNGSGATFIYAAFAENPFKYSNAR